MNRTTAASLATIQLSLNGMTDLQRSHAELRGALILAWREIRELNFGRNLFSGVRNFCKDA
jgi:hypothetical protein